MKTLDTFDPLPRFAPVESIQSRIAKAEEGEADYDRMLELARFEMFNHPLPDGSVEGDRWLLPAWL